MYLSLFHQGGPAKIQSGYTDFLIVEAFRGRDASVNHHLRDHRFASQNLSSNASRSRD